MAATNLSSPSPLIHLPRESSVQIQSSSIISSLNDVVTCLVKNSLDAQASNINISVDYATGSCKVEDNGHGIPAAAFRADGGLFQPNWTSRSPKSNSHGIVGMSLFSIAAVSRVTIVTRTIPGAPINTVTVQYSNRVLMDHEPASRGNLMIGDVGTTVNVRNLYGNIPVRLHHRALTDCGSRKLHNWRVLKRDIVAFLLAWPQAIQLILRGEASEEFLAVRVNQSLHHSDRISTHTDSVLRKHLLNILSLSSFINPSSWSSWVPINYVALQGTLNGVVSVEPAATKQCQFISVGITPLLPNEDHHQVFKRVNQIFLQSNFGVDRKLNDNKKIKDAHHVESQRIAKMQRSRGKRVDLELLDARCPMFCLKITLPIESESHLSDFPFLQSRNSLNMEQVASVLESAINQWLKQQHLLSGKRSPGNELPQLHNLFDSKSSKALLSCVGVPLPSYNRATSDVRTILDACSHFRTSNDKIQQQYQRRSKPSEDSQMLSMRAEETNSSHIWIATFLSGWLNPALRSHEPIFRKVAVDSLELADKNKPGQAQLSSGSQFRLSRKALQTATVVSQLDQKFLLVKMNGTASLSSGVNGNMIQQKKLLVLVDQHAADERCKLETLLESLCKPVHGLETTKVISNLGFASKVGIRRVSEDLSFSIDTAERLSLEYHASYFSEWGILYNLSEVVRGTIIVKEIRASIIALPPAIYERALSEPMLISNLLRSEIRRCWDSDRCLHERSESTPSKIPRGEDLTQLVETHQWVAKINSCPVHLVEMICSRACRSAIMFNDQLSLETCRKLLADLTQCAFPFQCAHGRPSAVPLIDIGFISEGVGKDFTAETSSFKEFSDRSPLRHGFARAYTAWRETIA